MTHTDQPHAGGKAKLLLVDDDPVSLLALEAVLDDLGQDLVRARSGEEALRQLAEQARQDEQRFRLVAENVKDFAIFMLDNGGHVASWNEGAARILGYRAEEVLGTHFSRFFTPEDNRADLPRRELEEAAARG